MANIVGTIPPSWMLADPKGNITPPWYTFLQNLASETNNILAYAPLNLRDYGAVGDGVTDDTAAILAWIADIQEQGREGFAPAGTYLGSAIDVSPTADVHIRCDKNAIFKHDGTVDVALFSFDGIALNPDFPSLTWYGGKIDCSAVPWSAPFGSGGTGFQLVRMNKCQFNNIWFYSGDSAVSDDGTTVTGGGDSGIATVHVTYINVTDCMFQGWPDLSIYVSGNANPNATDDGGEFIATNNYFYRTGGCGAKRQSRRVVIVNNVFVQSQIYLTKAGSGAIDLNPPKDVIIANNHIYKANEEAIEIWGAVGATITGNSIKDCGFEWDGTTVGPTADSGAGISCSGVSHSCISNNSIGLEELASTGNHRGIEFYKVVVQGTTFLSQYNNVSNNHFYKMPVGILESTQESYPNFYQSNSFATDVTTPFELSTLSNSRVQDFAIFAGQAVANLPAHPVKGMLAVVTNCTTSAHGATVGPNSGANNVLAWYNGTNWTVVGS